MNKYILLLAAVVAIPAFADSKLCDANLNELRGQLSDASKDATGDKVNEIQRYLDKAQKARDAGNYEECVEQSSKALEENEKPSKAD
ncbi:hypothetical protein JVX91_21220 [Pseudomonas sp. PDNC002]|uniref:hypothetical protein n=1 Tax=Pseudomonas sp. PDNC002 TaxID=2811422 RepID=UPI0019638606|nr:hypothetical protein [Pseudomonas sp. PDNC002]QRY78099.1 hypothetical protein JVX91_21220 [Pseudomonas sp. PDNC002]